MVVVNNFSEGRTEKAHEGFSKSPVPLYNKRKAKPSRSVPFLLIVAGKNAAGRLYFCHYHPRSEKKRKKAGPLLDGVRDIPDSAALACGGDVRVRVRRTQNRNESVKNFAQAAPFPPESGMVSAQGLPSWIVVLSTAQEAPHPPTPKGSRHFTGYGRLAHTRP